MKTRINYIIIITLIIIVTVIGMLSVNDINLTITGLAVYSTTDFFPTEAVDELGNDQISPNGGTVDLSDNIFQTITSGTTNTFVEVSAWNQNISEGSLISNVFLKAENDQANTHGADLIFQFENASLNWQTACITAASSSGTFSCDLYPDGVNTMAKVNALKTRIKVGDNNGGGAGRLNLDFISLAVNFTTEGNQSSKIGTVSFSVQSNIFLTLTDNTINLGILSLDENRSSEDVNDFFSLSNEGSVDFDVYSYGLNSPFLSNSDGANTLPNNYYLIHANYTDSGIANTTYVSVPANVSTKNLLITNLQHNTGLDTAKIGIKVKIPPDEEAGIKTANLVVYAEAH